MGRKLVAESSSPADLKTATLQSYFHDPALLQREWYAGTGPGAAADYKDKVATFSEQVITYSDSLAGDVGAQGQVFCPEIYPEYVQEYIEKDIVGRSILMQVTAPCLFCGGKGGPASGNYES